MVGVIAAIILAASGDPYVLWESDPVELSTAQKQTLSTQVLNRSPGLDISELQKLVCDRPNGMLCCTPWVNDPQTGEDIRAILLAGETWYPGTEAGTRTKALEPFCVAGTAQSGFVTFIGNIDPIVNEHPLIQVTFARTPDTTDVFMSARYKRPFDAQTCEDFCDHLLIPVGVVP